MVDSVETFQLLCIFAEVESPFIDISEAFLRLLSYLSALYTLFSLLLLRYNTI